MSVAVGNVQENNKMNPMVKGATIGAGAGVLLSLPGVIIANKEYLKLKKATPDKDTFIQQNMAPHIKNARAKYWEGLKKYVGMTKHITDKAERRKEIKAMGLDLDYRQSINTAKENLEFNYKTMLKQLEDAKGVRKTAIKNGVVGMLLTAAVGLGIGWYKNHKNNKAQQS